MAKIGYSFGSFVSYVLDALKRVTKNEEDIDALEAAESLIASPPIVDLPFKPQDMIKRLSGPLSVTRNSTSTIVNNSGVVETVGVDEPAVGRDGVGVYEAVTNECLYSEDFSNDSWHELAGTVKNTTASQVINPDGGTQATEFSFITNSIVRTFLTVESQNKTLSIWMYLTSNNSQTVELDYSDGATKAIDISGFELGRWYFLDYINASKGTGSPWFDIAIQGTSTCYFWGGQATSTPFLAPYTPTTASPVTRPADIITIPMSGNMPASGEPFTIVFDVNVKDVGTDVSVMFSAGSTAVNKIFDCIFYTASIFFRMSTGTSKHDASYGWSFQYSEGDRIRICCRHDGSTQSLLVDGVFKHSTSSNAAWDAPTLAIGQNADILGGDTLNGTIANFKIYDYALSDAQVAALGGPEDA